MTYVYAFVYALSQMIHDNMEHSLCAVLMRYLSNVHRILIAHAAVKPSKLWCTDLTGS